MFSIISRWVDENNTYIYPSIICFLVFDKRIFNSLLLSKGSLPSSGFPLKVMGGRKGNPLGSMLPSLALKLPGEFLLKCFSSSWPLSNPEEVGISWYKFSLPEYMLSLGSDCASKYSVRLVSSASPLMFERDFSTVWRSQLWQWRQSSISSQWRC